jgi:hypothetical protein
MPLVYSAYAFTGSKAPDSLREPSLLRPSSSLPAGHRRRVGSFLNDAGPRDEGLARTHAGSTHGVENAMSSSETGAIGTRTRSMAAAKNLTCGGRGTSLWVRRRSRGPATAQASWQAAPAAVSLPVSERMRRRPEPAGVNARDLAVDQTEPGGAADSPAPGDARPATERLGQRALADPPVCSDCQAADRCCSRSNRRSGVIRPECPARDVSA